MFAFSFYIILSKPSLHTGLNHAKVLCNLLKKILQNDVRKRLVTHFLRCSFTTTKIPSNPLIGFEGLFLWQGQKESNSQHTVLETVALPIELYPCGAENETRTRDPNLGKVVLYQLSYFRMATRTRLELVTSAVTGRHSNQLNHRAVRQFT